MSTFDRFKRKVLDIAGGTVETAYGVPSTLGAVLMSAAEAGVAAPDWSDRPKWLGGEGSEGMPFWSKEQGGQQFGEAINRWMPPPPTTESGKASMGAFHDALGLIDWPFAEFGRGVEGLTGSPAMGEASYWLTSLGLGGGIKPALGLAKKGLGYVAPYSKIQRPGWYSKNPIVSAAAQALLPAEMAASRLYAALSPRAGAVAEAGISPAADIRMAKVEKEITKPGADKSALAREYTGDVANQYAQRVQSGYAIDQQGPLKQAAREIFPREIEVSAAQLAADPQILSRLTGMNITDATASHITPFILSEFDAVGRGLPLHLAHKVESAASTGSMLGKKLKQDPHKRILENDHLINPEWPTATYKGPRTKLNKTGDKYRAEISTNPLGSVQAAWDSLITKRSTGTTNPRSGELYFTKDHKFTAQNFIDEIDELNVAKRNQYQRDLDLYNSGKRINSKGEIRPLARSKEDGSIVSKMPDPPVFLNRPNGVGTGFRQMMDGDGLISFGHSGITGDPLLGHVRVRTVMNPETGAMFQVAMDQLAPGTKFRMANKAMNYGMANQFISITPTHMSLKGSVLEGQGLKLTKSEIEELGEALATGKAGSGKFTSVMTPPEQQVSTLKNILAPVRQGDLPVSKGAGTPEAYVVALGKGEAERKRQRQRGIDY